MKSDTGVMYKSLDWLVGEPLKAIRVPHEEYLPDGDVTILKDYGKTFMLMMEYIAGHGWFPSKSRFIKVLIPKASIFCGDVRLKRKNGQMITGDMVIDRAYFEVIAE